MEYLLKVIASNSELKPLVNAQNESGNTPLHWAALNGHLEVVKLLCDNEADPFLKNEVGHDAYYEAQSNDQEEIVDYLLERYDVIPDEDEETENNETEQQSNVDTQETENESNIESSSTEKKLPNGN